MKIKLTKYVLAVLAITFALTSCSKSSDELASVASSKQDILSFKTVDEFNTTVQKVNSMKPEDRIAWENSKGFKSFGTICDEVYNGIDPTKFKSLQEVKDTVNALSDYLEMNQNAEGQYYVDLKECSNNARYLLNKDKMYIIGTTAYKSIGEELISDNVCNIEKLKTMNSSNLTDNAAKQRVKASIPAGRFAYQDLWGASVTVSGQKYVMRVVLETKPYDSQTRLDRYTFYNYKWTLWTYWGDYLSHTTSNIITITVSDLSAWQISQGIQAYSFRSTYNQNDEYYVTRTLYSRTTESAAGLSTYYLYYNIDAGNWQGAKVEVTYGTDFTATKTGIYTYPMPN